MRRAVDEAPLSEFVTKMRAVFVERLAAKSARDKREVEGRMKALMFEYLGRDAWEAALASAVATQADVPRDTSRDQSCHTSGASSEGHPDLRDGKLLAAGRD